MREPRIIAYTPEAMTKGSMWWWILPLAPDVPERLIVGNERAFMTWFYARAANRDAIDAETVDEYLRTFSGCEGVLGALGVYRAAFTTMAQTAPLAAEKVKVPIVALGGEQAQGLQIQKMVEMVAENVTGGAIPDCGHFVPEERPDELVRYVLAMIGKSGMR
jgi:pimeloyl-ACP methyl ester carboxylesterase